MFKIGDYVAHYKEGVCQVVDIGKISLSCSDNEKEYYTLKPIYDKDGTVYTPVENKKNQIREVITKQEAETLIAQLGDIEQLTVTDEKKREGGELAVALEMSREEVKGYLSSQMKGA